MYQCRKYLQAQPFENLATLCLKITTFSELSPDIAVEKKSLTDETPSSIMWNDRNLNIQTESEIRLMNESENNETVLPEKQVKRLRALLNEAETNLAAAKELLFSIIGDDDLPKRTPEEVTGKVIEGVFDGQTMHDADGKAYPVPANYASKSKLVEGDILKLTIADDGSFIYKQIGPVARRQVIGTLVQHDGAYYVEAGGKEFRVLLASVTFFKAHVGDQVSIIVPEDNRDAEWAAVEAVL